MAPLGILLGEMELERFLGLLGQLPSSREPMLSSMTISSGLNIAREQFRLLNLENHSANTTRNLL